MTTPGSAASEIRVLYIEDDENNIHLIKRILQSRPQIELLVAATGEEGLQLATTMLPNLVLLDRHLPDLHGNEVLARLKSEPRTADIPVIMVSGDSGGQDGPGEGAGAVAVLRKPFEISALLAMIDRHTTDVDPT